MNHFPIEIKEGYLFEVYDPCTDEFDFQMVCRNKRDELIVANDSVWTHLESFNNKELTTPVAGMKLMRIFDRSIGNYCTHLDTSFRDVLWYRGEEEEEIEIDDSNLHDEIAKCKTLSEVVDVGAKYFENNSDISHEDAKKMSELFTTTALISTLMGFDLSNLN